MCGTTCCRDAREQQWASERRKRQQIEAKKAQELQQHRSQISEWQAGLATSQQLPSAADSESSRTQLVQNGDESDYESDGGDAESADDRSDALMPDDPHYYGKGWTAKQQAHQHNTSNKAFEAGPSQPAARHNGLPQSIEGEEICPHGATNEPADSAVANSDKLAELSKSCQASTTSLAVEFRSSESAQKLSGNSQEPSISDDAIWVANEVLAGNSNSTGVVNDWGLTPIATTTTGAQGSSIATSNSQIFTAGGQHQDAQEAAVAFPPPRSKLQPIAVQFTELETPHLPAREQREEEIRTIKKRATNAKVGNIMAKADEWSIFSLS